MIYFQAHSHSFHLIKLLFVCCLIDVENCSTKFSYSFNVTMHQMFSVLTLFPDNSSCSFHRIELKHGRQLDYEVAHVVSRLQYTNFHRVIAR